MEPVTLRTDRLVLDLPTVDDIPLITEYCQDPVFERFMTLPWPYHRGDAEFFVERFVPRGWEFDAEYTWAVRESGRFLGVIGLRAESSMVGFWLGAPHRGHGYMPEALDAVVDWAFSRDADVVRWECMIGNRASLSVARKGGFTFTGAAPTAIADRDGAHPEAWHGVLRAGDDRSVKDGWP